MQATACTFSPTLRFPAGGSTALIVDHLIAR
jgi:hypothetical protein